MYNKYKNEYDKTGTNNKCEAKFVILLNILF